MLFIFTSLHRSFFALPQLLYGVLWNWHSVSSSEEKKKKILSNHRENEDKLSEGKKTETGFQTK